MKLPLFARRSIVLSVSFVIASILVLAVSLLSSSHQFSWAVWADA